MKALKATCIATSNIALVKYWGKRDKERNLPANSSLSITMDEQLRTTTTVEFSKSYKSDEAQINGVRLKGEELSRVVGTVDYLRRFSKTQFKARVVSENSFPTAAGLASSASGFAALTLATVKALQLELQPRQLSVITRLGSGSACRSLYGGFVEWKRGTLNDGSDSYSEQIAPETHWPELRNVIAIVQAGRKKQSSRKGMQQTAATSDLYQRRLAQVPYRMQRVKEAIRQKNLGALLEETMKDSNSMHAVMLDSYPPILHLTDASRQVIDAVHEFNGALGDTAAGYTFDAGPNAQIITTEKRAPAIGKILSEIGGVQSVITCRQGKGPQFTSKHLF
ncbi:MAG: diphosphomevalonate decarboxylase [Candidatus Micrarchaeota archaeon]